jgi:aquaporin rerated protein, other eukaryote
MCLVGALPWIRGVLLTIAQILGALIAAAVVQAVFPGKLKVQTALSSETSVVQGFLIETFLTFQLVITILMLAAEKHAATFIAPVSTECATSASRG